MMVGHLQSAATLRDRPASERASAPLDIQPWMKSPRELRCSNAHVSKAIALPNVSPVAEMLIDTLLGFKTTPETAADRIRVVWISEYFGPVKRADKTFDQKQGYRDHQGKVLASVGLPQLNPDTFGENVRRMRERKLTFEEAISAAEFSPGREAATMEVRRWLFGPSRTDPVCLSCDTMALDRKQLSGGWGVKRDYLAINGD